MNGWKCRYVVLHSTTIYWFRDSQPQVSVLRRLILKCSCIGAFALDCDSRVEAIEYFPNSPFKHRGFVVKTPKGLRYFSTNTEYEQGQWIQAIDDTLLSNFGRTLLSQ